MRSVACPWCGVITDEASAGWDLVRGSGQCPGCKRFLDEARELGAQARIASRVLDPRFRRGVVLRRIYAGAVALVLVPVVLLALRMHPPLGIGALGLLVTVGSYALFATPESDLRGWVGRIRKVRPADGEKDGSPRA